jgi:hypothetical protein
MPDQELAQDRQESAASERPGVDARTPQAGSLADASYLGSVNGAVTAPTGSGGLRGEFERRLAEVKGSFESTISDLHRMADAMRDGGLPPGYRLVQALGDSHRRFLRLRLDLTRRAESLGLCVPPSNQLAGLQDLSRLIEMLPDREPAASPVASPSVPAEPVVAKAAASPEPSPATPAPIEWNGPIEAVSVAAFDPLPPARFDLPMREPARVETAPAKEVEAPLSEPEHAVEQPEEAIRRAALVIVEKALRLTVRDGGESAPLLAECLERAHALRDEILNGSPSALPAETVALATGEHPLAGLLKVVEAVEGLTDSDWATLHSQISQAFGRPLAIAAARGRFVLKPDE